MKQCHLITSSTFSSQESFENALIKLFDLTKISIKDLFNNKLRNDSKSELAIRIDNCLKNGKLVSTDLITELVGESIKGITNGILITGYPRTKEQFNSLEILLSKSNFEINRMWVLELKNIEDLISERNYENVAEEMRKKHQDTIKQNNEILKLIENPKIISKIDLDYPVNWKKDEIKEKIKSVHNTI
ncbi:nucleoside monophosphate kinase [uncultured Aquimarina sp.]|uniref:nucleoside monophosphate kinase n=1 Tax=uncultured Aquimarina sp. TaxID=575652 RepID=UPI0026321E31|nr:nucleoside monophosphate kinase [uncultured Aquimarina sp.]